MALHKLGLDQVWWLVSPQNPLKSATGMAPLAQRLASARKMARHPRIFATDIEETLNTRFTVDTVSALQNRFAQTRFVWLMGADNMINLPRWKQWQVLMESIPIAIYPRPGYTLKARLSPAALAFRSSWVPSISARTLPTRQTPALCFLEGPESGLSATAIRHQKTLSD